jgi:hypothetical protein
MSDGTREFFAVRVVGTDQIQETSDPTARMVFDELMAALESCGGQIRRR